MKRLLLTMVFYLPLIGKVSSVYAAPPSTLHLATELTNSNAVQSTITGTVVDDSGTPLPGVSIREKGTSNGALTDFDGNFSIDVASSSSVLIFSYVGMKTVEMTVGDQTTLSVKLSEDAQALDEVVVTALGIKREEKTLTYANQKVDGEDLTKARDINFVSSLSGRAAGVDIKKSSSGSGGSTKIVLRGNKSLSGDSQPLFVIDGIPLANNKGSQPEMWGGIDQGDGLSQINQDDIESITVLKGANAAVLYGSQGANGVVLITTKSGKKGMSKVTVNTGVTFQSVTGIPDLQFKYGSVNGAKESWSYEAGDYASDYVDDFFDTGVNYINSVSVSGGNDITTAYFSLSNTSSNGIMPTNKYLKNNATFKQSTKLFDEKVTINSNVMLSYEKATNRTPAGYYLNPITGLYMFPRDRDFNEYKEYQYFDTERNMYLQNWFVADHLQSNPYWILNKEPKTDHTRRVIANLGITYDITDHLKLQLRGNYDFASKTFEQQHAAGSNSTNTHANGRLEYTDYKDNLMYTDALFTYTNTFGDISFTGVAGASYQKTVYGKGTTVDTGTNGLIYPNEFYFQNIETNVQVQSVLGSQSIKQGAFVNTQFGYKDMLFIDLSGRQDWASTLAGTGNDSYFYPALGVTGIISEMVTLPEFISFAKVRASYSNVANEVPFNRINPQNTITSGGGVELNTTAPFTNLKPEIISSMEYGLDWRFFNNRLGIDVTYYNLNSKDQFIELPAPSGSQYTTYYVNAGEIVNKGVEISLTGKPIASSDFSWDTTFNFAINKNEVVELHPDLTDPISLGDSEGYQSKIVAGGSIGDLYVYKFERDEQGRIMLENGVPLKTATTEYIGNSNPDWSLGWSNTISYKSASLSMLFSGKFGGKVISQTEAMLDGYGVSQRTADARDNGGVTINGVQDGVAVTTVDPQTWYTAIGDRNGIKEPYVYDRTNIRLSQLALSYKFNLEDWKFPLKDLSLSLVGSNLFFIYKDAPYDPELTMNTGTSYQSLDNFNMPATATYGVNVTLTF